jgi:hypothetical protein
MTEKTEIPVSQEIPELEVKLDLRESLANRVKWDHQANRAMLEFLALRETEARLVHWGHLEHRAIKDHLELKA